jgi:hypothetical protein
MSHLFENWARVSDGSRTGVVVWDPTAFEYKVLWDDNGWEPFEPSEAKRLLKEAA